MNFCPECGSKNESFKYCPTCGKELQVENTSSSIPVVPLFPEMHISNDKLVDFLDDDINVSELASELNQIHNSYEWGEIKKCADGVMYKGEFLNGLRHGKGQSFYAYFPPGTVQYDGNWIEGKLNGFVTCYNPYGEITFEGSFINDEKQGLGKLYDNGKLVYEGNFEKNKVTGIGIVYYEDGTMCYDGELNNYEPHGKGTYYHSEKRGKGLTLMGNFFEGEIYSGDWDDGVRTGIGEIKIIGGDRYFGGWQNDMRHGKGSQYLSAYKMTIEGEWEYNEFSGKGSMEINGITYRGNWKSILEPEGEFEAVHPDGSIIKGALIYSMKENVLTIDFLTDKNTTGHRDGAGIR